MSDKQYIKSLEEEIEKLRYDREASIKIAEQNEQLIKTVNDNNSMIHSLRCKIRQLEDTYDYEQRQKYKIKTTREIIEEQYYKYGRGYYDELNTVSNDINDIFYDSVWSEDADDEPKKKIKNKKKK
jgi:hypothetical protein